MLDFVRQAGDDPDVVSAFVPDPPGRWGGPVLFENKADRAQECDDLLARVATHRDRAAFARLFQHYAPRLKAYMRKLGCDDAEAEDLAQEAMLSVWRKADSFDSAKAGLSTWIFTIARNLRIDKVRRQRRPELDPDDPTLVPAPPMAADDCLSVRRAGDAVRKAVAGLPPDQAQVVALSFYEDQPHAEIAARLGVPLGTVKSRLRLAMKRIRAALGDEV